MLATGNLLNQTDQRHLQSVVKLFEHLHTPEHNKGIECLGITGDGLGPLVRKKLEDGRSTKQAERQRSHRFAIALVCVLTIAWNLDGKVLASGSNDQTVKPHDGAADKPLASLQGYAGDVYSVAWSPDGKTLATGSDDQTVKLWEATTGKLLANLSGHTDSICTVAWSPDGKTLASSSGDTTMKLWEAATGKLLASLQGHTGDVRGVAWSPDGKTLVSGCTDQTVKLWEVATGKLLASLQEHTDGVLSVAWSPDGRPLPLVPETGRLSFGKPPRANCWQPCRDTPGTSTA
jgi:WD40 repeat protein